MRKTLLSILTGIIIAGAITGCKDTEEWYFSPTKYVKGTVKDKKYTAKYVKCLSSFIESNPKNKLNMSKETEILQEQFEVYFRANFNADTIPEEAVIDNADIYDNSKIGQKAMITYFEKFAVKYKDINNDGKKELIYKKSRGYTILKVQLQ